MAEGTETRGLERLALIIGMIWVAIWSAVGYVMILWMRSLVDYSFRIPIAHSHGLCFAIVFLITMLVMIKSEAPLRVRQVLVGVGLFTTIGYPLSQLGEIIGILYLTDVIEILFVLYLLSMAYVVYKMKV